MTSDSADRPPRIETAAFWDARFTEDGYLFGTEPADFLRQQAAHIPAASRVLCVGDGEGRNAVWLAGQGHQVTAFDISPLAVDKAKALAQAQGVDVSFNVSGIEDWDWAHAYDAVVAIFVQFAPPDLRTRLFGWLNQSVRPGGVLLLHGYAPRQVDYGTGGPPLRDHMYTAPMLRAAFADWEILRLADYDAMIDEGPGHSGKSALVDLVARRAL